MEVLAILRNIVSQCAKVITFGAQIQGKAKNELITSLQDICGKCENSYSQVLAKLLPIKNSFNDDKNLALALREFAADKKTRDAFKPEKLCGKVDVLLGRLENNLDSLKYSIDIMRIKTIRNNIDLIGNLDSYIRDQYDEFTKALDQLSYELEKGSVAGSSELRSYVEMTITDFENELSATISSVREAKNQILGKQAKVR